MCVAIISVDDLKSTPHVQNEVERLRGKESDGTARTRGVLENKMSSRPHIQSRRHAGGTAAAHAPPRVIHVCGNDDITRSIITVSAGSILW